MRRSAGKAENQELTGALQVLNDSQSLLRILFLGLALEYKSLDQQRRQLICRAAYPEAVLRGPDPLAIQIASSLVTLCALFGFQRQAEALAQQEAQSGGCPDMTDVNLGAAEILIALLQLAKLSAAGPQESDQEDLNLLESDAAAAEL